MKLIARKFLKKAIAFSSGHMRRSSGFPYAGPQPRSIAYFAGGGIGDIIMAWPSVQFLKKSFPSATMDIFVPRKKRGIIKELFSDCAVNIHSATSLRTGFLLRGVYDIAFSNTVAAFHAAIECNAYLCSKACYGFRYPDESPGKRLYSETIPLADNSHDIDQNCRLIAQAFSLPFHGIKGPFPATRPKPDPETAGVVIHPGVERGYAYKLWPVERYKDLALRIAASGHRVTILLGPSETHMAAQFAGLDRIRVVCNPDAQELISEIRSAKLFVGNDSGPAHIAAFLATPGITLIGPADPVRTEPRGAGSVTVYNKTDCSPCHFSAHQCADNICMKSITVDQVWKAIKQIIP